MANKILTYFLGKKKMEYLNLLFFVGYWIFRSRLGAYIFVIKRGEI